MHVCVCMTKMFHFLIICHVRTSPHLNPQTILSQSYFSSSQLLLEATINYIMSNHYSYHSTQQKPYPNHLESATQILLYHSTLSRVYTSVKSQTFMTFPHCFNPSSFGLPLIPLESSTLYHFS